MPRTISVGSMDDLINYTISLMEDGGWEATYNSYLPGLIATHPHGDVPNIGVVCYLSESDGLSDGGEFASKFGRLLQVRVAEDWTVPEYWAMVVKADFPTSEQSDFLQYFLNHFGIGYLNIDGDRDNEMSRFMFRQNESAAIPLMPDHVKESAMFGDKSALDDCDLEALAEEMDIVKHRVDDYGIGVE